MMRYLIPLSLVLALMGTACSSDSADETTTTASAPATTTTAAATTAAAPTTQAPTTQAPTTTTGGGAINIANFTFNPGNITVAVGTTLTWTNGDGPSHTTTSDEEGWDSGVLASGDSFELVFDIPGVFAYHCSIHPSMSATVTVEG